MKSSLLWMLGAGLGLFLACPVPALADSKTPLNMELVGIENVLAVISNVNIRQVDIKTNQAVTDLMEDKNQMYQPGLRLVQQEKKQMSNQLATYGKRPASTRALRTLN